MQTQGQAVIRAQPQQAILYSIRYRFQPCNASKDSGLLKSGRRQHKI
jgi:hypothetical protein